MINFLVGTRVEILVPVTDIPSDTVVDPVSIAFRLVAPEGSLYPVGTYSWNGATWTVSESVIGVPSRISVGTFVLSVTIPYSNDAAGRWSCGWKTVANGAGLGEGSGEVLFSASPTSVL
jgi:hypothetical protein